MNYLVYPGHGPIKLIKKESKTIGGIEQSLLVFECLATKLKILVPEKELEKRTRSLTGKKEVKDLNSFIHDGETPKITVQTWNRRYRDVQNKIREGSLADIALVIKELNHLATIKELSFGEKRLKETVETLFKLETDLVLN